MGQGVGLEEGDGSVHRLWDVWKEGRKIQKQMGERQYLFDVGSRCGVTIIPIFLYIGIFLILLICLKNSRESTTATSLNQYNF